MNNKNKLWVYPATLGILVLLHIIYANLFATHESGSGVELLLFDIIAVPFIVIAWIIDFIEKKKSKK